MGLLAYSWAKRTLVSGAILSPLVFLLVLSPGSVLGQQITQFQDSSRFFFVENKGQWPDWVHFRADIPGGRLFIEDGRFLYRFDRNDHMHHAHDGGPVPKDAVTGMQIVQAKFLDSKKEWNTRGSRSIKEYFNFFIGKDPSKWASMCQGFRSVAVKDLYPGVDLEVFEKNTASKYEMTLQAGVDPSVIRIQYKGHESIKVSRRGDLEVNHTLGQIIEERPYAYQIVNGNIREVACRFALDGDVVGFELGEYREDLALVIDPVMIFASYSGSVSDNFGMTATYDHDGNLYSAGMVYGNAYPTTTSAYDQNSNFTVVSGTYGITDVFITKYSADGTSRIFSTYLGGGNNSSGTETAHSLICNEQGELHIFGTTSSDDFPTTAGCYDDSWGGGNYVGFLNNGAYFVQSGQPSNVGGSDIYVAKFNASGSALLGCTYVGGSGNDGLNYNASSPGVYDSLMFNYGDQFRGEIMLDSAGNVFVASCTRSTDFPTVNPFGPGYAGDQDGVAFCLDPTLSTMLWSSYIGGSDNDACYSIKLSDDHEAYIAGGTTSSDFPVSPGSVYNSFQGGEVDGFIIHLDATGTVGLQSTFFGTTAYDQTYFVEVDRWKKVYITGQTEGVMPISPNTWGIANSSQFIARLNSDFTNIEFQTTYGNGNGLVNMSPTAFLVDVCGNIYVSAWGADLYNLSGLQDSPTVGMPVTSDAIQPSPAGSPGQAGYGQGFHLIVLTRDAAALEYGTYLGSWSAKEHVDGGTSRFDNLGVVYQSVCGGCGGTDDFPTSPANVVSHDNLSSNCNNLVFKFDFEIVPKAEFTVDQIEGCVPLTVQFSNFSTDSTNYMWIFDNGDTSTTEFNPIRTFSDTGTYVVQLLLTDTICNLVDTAQQVIQVYTQLELEAHNDTVICGSTTLDLWANSNGSASAFQWSSDSTFSDTLNSGPMDSVLTTFITEPGTYYVRVTNPWCELVDSVVIDFLETAVTIDSVNSICLGQTAVINAHNSNPSVTISYDWSPDAIIVGPDGDSTVIVQPTTGQFVHLTATGSNGCVMYDSVWVGVSSINGAVTAWADDDTIPEGGSTTLHAGPNGYSYGWVPPFGLDDPFSQNPVATLDEDQTYWVFVSSGACMDSAMVTIRTLEFVCGDPTIFVPNAFTPDGNGQNDMVFVRGDNIEVLYFAIYDRWGELVFETRDQAIGWDGTFKDAILDPDVYDYYLEATCVGGMEYFQKGNITLIR